ncbi:MULTISPECIES: hypothetical protein [Microbacterium]|uniref:Uncharacterized protein n=1 Tax=Microbacterium maritypicum TaxID=33918 RepID=A0ACD4BBF2_MICMQ|nr:MULTISPECIES: hypothetical protein [Microbacterium]EYT59030.1 dinucleotide-utilizing enzyme [Microbacterium sp. UCD-TDU]MBP5801940.1 hypothetical protein [Microbacterium liquefaciens]UTT54517.1 hypothetical protein NMQ05_08050 [Microbacterium liquefaciens]
MNKSLIRSMGFWLLLVVSLATTAVGAWLISGQIGTMTTTLLDGTATGVEVYVGQSLVVVGAGVLAAGIVGILLTLALVAARSLVPAPAPAVVEAIDWTVEAEETPAPVTTTPPADTTPATEEVVDEAEVTRDDAPATDAKPDSSPSITR